MRPVELASERLVLIIAPVVVSPAFNLGVVVISSVRRMRFLSKIRTTRAKPMGLVPELSLKLILVVPFKGILAVWGVKDS